MTERPEKTYLFSSSWTGMGSWDRPCVERTSKLARASWRNRQRGCNIAQVSWQNIRVTWQELTEPCRKPLIMPFEAAYFSWLMVIATQPRLRVFYVRLVKGERARMNSLPAYTSITGGGRLGNKRYKSNYVYVFSQVLAMPDNLLWQRRSWPVGFKTQGRLYRTRQECTATYALWSGWRKLEAKLVKFDSTGRNSKRLSGK